MGATSTGHMVRGRRSDFGERHLIPVFCLIVVLRALVLSLKHRVITIETLLGVVELLGCICVMASWWVLIAIKWPHVIYSPLTVSD